ncbi:MAG TPA: hypothetical protein VIP51_11905 [Eoetvoesiella sp.]
MKSRFLRTFLLMLTGPIVWAVHFLFIYAVNGVACARPDLQASWAGSPASSWIIGVGSLLALAAMVLILLCQRKQMPGAGTEPEFMLRLGRALCMLSAVAILWETIPVLLVPACG